MKEARRYLTSVALMFSYIKASLFRCKNVAELLYVCPTIIQMRITNGGKMHPSLTDGAMTYILPTSNGMSLPFGVVFSHTIPFQFSF